MSEEVTVAPPSLVVVLVGEGLLVGLLVGFRVGIEVGEGDWVSVTLFSIAGVGVIIGSCDWKLDEIRELISLKIRAKISMT